MKKITTAGSKGCEEGRKRETIFHQCLLTYHTEFNEYIVIIAMQEPTYWKYIVGHCYYHHFWPHCWPSKRDDQTTYKYLYPVFNILDEISQLTQIRLSTYIWVARTTRLCCIWPSFVFIVGAKSYRQPFLGFLPTYKGHLGIIFRTMWVKWVSWGLQFITTKAESHVNSSQVSRTLSSFHVSSSECAQSFECCLSHTSVWAYSSGSPGLRFYEDVYPCSIFLVIKCHVENIVFTMKF